MMISWLRSNQAGKYCILKMLQDLSVLLIHSKSSFRSKLLTCLTIACES